MITKPLKTILIYCLCLSLHIISLQAKSDCVQCALLSGVLHRSDCVLKLDTQVNRTLLNGTVKPWDSKDTSLCVEMNLQFSIILAVLCSLLSNT